MIRTAKEIRDSYMKNDECQMGFDQVTTDIDAASSKKTQMVLNNQYTIGKYSHCTGVLKAELRRNGFKTYRTAYLERHGGTEDEFYRIVDWSNSWQSIWFDWKDRLGYYAVCEWK